MQDLGDLDISSNPLVTLRRDVEDHWRKYLPKMTAELEAEEAFEAAVEAAMRSTRDAVLGAVERGMPLLQAWEIYRESWAFLPAEEGWDVEEEDDEEDDEPFGPWWVEDEPDESYLDEEEWTEEDWDIAERELEEEMEALRRERRFILAKEEAEDDGGV